MRYLFVASLCFLLSTCEPNDHVVAPVPVPEGVELVSTGYEFTEGPEWCDAGYLLFSDVTGNKVYRWDGDSVETFLSSSSNANGISCWHGDFYICRHGARDLAKVSQDGIAVSYVSGYNGLRFNSPNDIVVSAEGCLYFTDPNYGVADSDREMDYTGAFVMLPGSAQAELFDETLQRPNGIALSPDQKLLYVCETASNSIYVYDISASGRPVNKRLFCVIQTEGELDGLACHSHGYLFAAVSVGVEVISAAGLTVGYIPFPAKEKVRNLCFGGSDGDTLFVTAGRSLMKVEFVAL